MRYFPAFMDLQGPAPACWLAAAPWRRARPGCFSAAGAAVAVVAPRLGEDLAEPVWDGERSPGFPAALSPAI